MPTQQLPPSPPHTPKDAAFRRMKKVDFYNIHKSNPPIFLFCAAGTAGLQGTHGAHSTPLATFDTAR